MLCEATLSDDALKLAVPLASETLPSDAAPSMNVTDPVGVPDPGALAATVAMNVADCPNTDGFGLALTVVVVAA